MEKFTELASKLSRSEYQPGKKSPAITVLQELAKIKQIQGIHTVKPVLNGHSKRRPKLVFKTDYRLMQVKSIAECSKWSILQYFRPSLSYHLPLRALFCLFLSGRLRQVLLYMYSSISTRKQSLNFPNDITTVTWH